MNSLRLLLVMALAGCSAAGGDVDSGLASPDGAVSDTGDLTDDTSADTSSDVAPACEVASFDAAQFDHACFAP